MGYWQGKREIVGAPGSDPTAGYTLSLIKLSIDANDGFKLTEGGFERNGHIERSGKHARLVITSFLNRNVDPELPENSRQLTYDEAGKILFEVSPQEVVTLERVHIK